MNILKYSFTLIVLMIFFYRYGIITRQLLKREEKKYKTLLNGFITFFAIFEIIVLPFNIFKLNIKLLYYIQLIANISLIIISFIVNKENDIKTVKSLFKINEKINKKSLIQIKSKIFNTIKNNKKELVLSVITCTMILIQIILSTFLHNSNADDSFYISWAQEAKKFEQYMQTDPSTGQENSTFSKIYIFDSWEIFYGFTARTFNIETATVAHTIIPAVLILLSYCAYYCLFEKIDNKNSKLMLFILSWIFLFSGVSGRFRGYTLLMRIWQGKTILTNIFIPIVLANIYEMEINRKNIIQMIIINIASIAFNPIAIWMLPVIYFFFTVVMLFEGKIKSVFKMLIVILPELIVLPIYLKMAIGGTEGTIQVNTFVTYLDALKDFVRNGQAFVVIYLISYIITIFDKNKKVKILLNIIPALTFLTILNPLVCKYVQKYVTSSDTYWRLYWLIPIELTITYASSKIINMINKKSLKVGTLTAIIILIAIFGKNMYTSSGEFSKHQNTMKIPTYIVEETNAILNNSKGKAFVLAPAEPIHGAFMRQVSNDIILVRSRIMYDKNMKNPNEKIEMYNKIYSEFTKEKIYDVFENNIDFIIISITNKEELKYIDESIAKIIYEDKDYIIIKNVMTK